MNWENLLWTGGCSLKHVPGFIERSEELIVDKGIDEIICITGELLMPFWNSGNWKPLLIQKAVRNIITVQSSFIVPKCRCLENMIGIVILMSVASSVTLGQVPWEVVSIFVCQQMLPSIMKYPPLHALISSRSVSMRGGESVCTVHFLVIFPHSHGGVHCLFI